MRYETDHGRDPVCLAAIWTQSPVSKHILLIIIGQFQMGACVPELSNRNLGTCEAGWGKDAPNTDPSKYALAILCGFVLCCFVLIQGLTI